MCIRDRAATGCGVGTREMIVPPPSQSAKAEGFGDELTTHSMLRPKDMTTSCFLVCRMKCIMLTGKSLGKWTSVSAKSFLIELISCGRVLLLAVWRLWPATACDGSPSVCHSIKNTSVWPWQQYVSDVQSCSCP